jgi:ABC-type spermidine/putrescine transport system permease subunit II
MKMSSPWRVAFIAFCAIVLLYLILPILIIVPMSFSSTRFLTFRRLRCRCAGTRTMSPAPPGCRRRA